MNKIIRCALFLSLILIACNENLLTPDNEIEIRQSGNELRIKNNSNATVYYFMAAEKIAPLILWAPAVCDSCPHVPAFSAIAVELPTDFHPDETYIVYYWKRVYNPESNKYEADQIRHIKFN